MEDLFKTYLKLARKFEVENNQRKKLILCCFLLFIISYFIILHTVNLWVKVSLIVIYVAYLTLTIRHSFMVDDIEKRMLEKRAEWKDNQKVQNAAE